MVLGFSAGALAEGEVTSGGASLGFSCSFGAGGGRKPGIAPISRMMAALTVAASQSTNGFPAASAASSAARRASGDMSLTRQATPASDSSPGAEYTRWGESYQLSAISRQPFAVDEGQANGVDRY
jgi:hypothetical protein